MDAGKVPVEFLLDFYDTFLREGDIAKVAAALDIKSTRTLQSRIDKYPALAYAKKVAEERRGGRETLSGYVYKQLSPEAREIWDKMQFWDDAETSFAKVEAILAGKTKRVRQELFVHALINSGFDLSEACRMVGVSRGLLDKWRNDTEFRQLLEEIGWHKKNFFERALVGLVEERHPGAVIFVNRTYNSDRGYSEKVRVEHSGSVGDGFQIEDLDLDLETRKIILEAIRRKKASVPAEGTVVDAVTRQLTHV